MDYAKLNNKKLLRLYEVIVGKYVLDTYFGKPTESVAKDKAYVEQVILDRLAAYGPKEGK